MRLLRYVPPGELDAHWAEVERGIEASCRKFSARSVAAQVRAQLESGRAGLFMVDGKGFFVFQHVVDGGQRVFYVWIMYGRNMIHLFPQLMAEIDDMARDAGCPIVRMQSHRKAWRRLPYFREQGVIYEREVAQ